MFLVSSLINVPIFHIVWLDTFWTDLVYICEWSCLKRAEGVPDVLGTVHGMHCESEINLLYVYQSLKTNSCVTLCVMC